MMVLHSPSPASSSSSSSIMRRRARTQMPERPSHAASVAFLCVQNALRMHPQAQLCPPGRARRELQALLRQNPPPRFVSSLDLEAIFSYPSGPLDPDEEEDASSADEDDLVISAEELQDTAAIQREALYIPAGTDPTTTKLPFNRRKLRYFDGITASDRTTARHYVQAQFRRHKQRHALALRQYLQKVQRQERIRLGRAVGPEPKVERMEGFTPLPNRMSPSLSAALLLESLQVDPKESLEGMAKC